VVVAFVLTVLSGIVLVACLQHARAQGWKAPGLRSSRPVKPLPKPPPEDCPPAGLSPLIPSPRALANEFERGLRELALFLAVQARD
jgi:hypothetical protein